MWEDWWPAGGLTYVDLPSSTFPQMPFLVLRPDQLPTNAQAAGMEVVIYHESRYTDIDAVYVRADFSGPCDRCMQEELTCTPQEQAAQQGIKELPKQKISIILEKKLDREKKFLLVIMISIVQAR